MPLFSKGLILAQHKEPALSRPIVRFVNPAADNMEIGVRKLAVSSEQEAIIEMARLAGIVDERDGKPVHELLSAAMGKAEIVIADAVDDEPYVSSKLAVLLQYSEEVADGLEICRRVAGCQKSAILVYKILGDTQTRIPLTLEGIRVTRVRSKYPATAAARLGKFRSRRKLVIGVGALIHLARAAYKQKVQSSTFITVAGNCVTNPMNLEVSLNMTVMQVLERCGLTEQPTRVVCGGAMTGLSVIDPENTLVTHTTRAILAIRDNIKDRQYRCIGCGRCEQVCPAGLNPMYIRRLIGAKHYKDLAPFDAHMCIACGTCSYVCPSKRRVSYAVNKAKRYALAKEEGGAQD